MAKDKKNGHEGEEEVVEGFAEDVTEEEEQNPFETFVDKQRVAAEEFTKALEELFPAGFREHTRKAGKAFVESFKVLLDSAREDLEDLMRRRQGKEEEMDEEEGGDTKVKVDIE